MFTSDAFEIHPRQIISSRVFPRHINAIIPPRNFTCYRVGVPVFCTKSHNTKNHLNIPRDTHRNQEANKGCEKNKSKK